MCHISSLTQMLLFLHTYSHKTLYGIHVSVVVVIQKVCFIYFCL